MRFERHVPRESHDYTDGQFVPGSLRTKVPYVLLGFGAALFFYLHLFHFPAVPIWHDGDLPIYLDHAERMFDGQVLYRDLFQFNMPGTEYLYCFLFRGFGVHLWIAQLSLFLTAVTSSLLIYSLSRTVLSGAQALLPPIAYLAICQRSSLDGSHNWYSSLFVLAAVNLLARAPNLFRIGFAGALLGMATIFTSTRGAFVAAGVCLFLVWKARSWRKALSDVFAILAPFTIVVSSVLTYLAALVGSRVLFYSLIVFPIRYYSSGYGNGPSIFFDELTGILPLRPNSILPILLWIMLNAAIPLVFVAFISKCLRPNAPDLHTSQRSQDLVLYLFAGLSALLGVSGAPSAPRLNCAAAFAYILATVLLREFGGRRLVGVVLAVAAAAGIAEIAVAAMRRVYIVEGPHGAVAFLNRDAFDYTSWLAQIAHPDDGLFGSPTLNFVLGLSNPSKLEWAEPNAYTRPEQVWQLVNALKHHHTRFVLVDYAPEDQGAPGDNLQPLRAFLKEQYRPVQCPNSNAGIFIEIPSTDNDAR